MYNSGPHLKGSRRPRKKVARPLPLRRPKVAFFGAQAEKNRFFFRHRPVMVFGGKITFSTPPKTFSAANNFLRPPVFFFGAQNQNSELFRAPIIFCGTHFFFSAPKTKNRLFRREPKEQNFSAPKRKNLGFFFIFWRRPVMVFGGEITFSTPEKYFAAAFFFFLGAPKNRRLSAPKTKNRLFRRHRRSKGLKVAFWVQAPCEPLAVKIVLCGSNEFRVFRGTHLEGPRRLRMTGS